MLIVFDGMLIVLLKVLNVANLTILDESWRRSEDHAKWAVTVDKHWICIGDINREVFLMLYWLDLQLFF